MSDIEKRLDDIEARLNKLEGKPVPKEAPAPKAIPPKTAAGEFPKWIYRMGADGKPQSALIERAEDLPAEYAESPADLPPFVPPVVNTMNTALTPAPAPPPAPPEPTSTLVEIPADWKDMHHTKRISLARSLPGAGEVRTAEDADIIIGLELERRGNA